MSRRKNDTGVGGTMDMIEMEMQVRMCPPTCKIWRLT